MPIARVQLADGSIARLEVPEGITEEEILAFAATIKLDQKAIEPSYGEAARTMAQNAAVEVGAGLFGTAQALNPFADEGAGASGVQTVRDKFSYKPGPEGQKALENIVPYVEKGMEYARVPASGLVGLGELATGQGLDQAVESIDNVQAQGTGVVLGDRTLEETNSPEAAIVARMAPDVALSALGLNAAKKLPQSKAKQQIANKIASGSSDTDTVGYQLVKPVEKSPGVNLSSNKELSTKVQPRVKKDKRQLVARKQGFTEGAIANVTSSNPVTRKIMKDMVNVMEKAKKNDKYAKRNRPSNLLGDSVMNRFRVVKNQNQKAGAQLDGVAEKLKRQPVDVDPAVESFLSRLERMGIQVNRQDGISVNFKGSDIEKISETENIIKDIMSRMKDTKVPDAYDVHRLKKYIDEQVTYGKNAKGLSGTIERSLKELRHDLDGILDSNFPEYDAVNSTYSQTVNALDAVQDAMGKVDLLGPSADKAIGTKMRTLLSNNAGRVNFETAIDELEGVASQYRRFNDDLDSLTVFVDALDKRFGPVAETSFQGQIVQGVQQGARAAADPSGRGMGDLVSDLATKGYNKATGVTDDRAYKAIRDLLK